MVISGGGDPLLDFLSTKRQTCSLWSTHGILIITLSEISEKIGTVLSENEVVLRNFVDSKFINILRKEWGQLIPGQETLERVNTVFEAGMFHHKEKYHHYSMYMLT